MTDKDVLNTLYHYMKLVKPEEDISLKHSTVKYIFIDGPSLEFMSIYCKNKEIIIQVTDGMRIPSWFMKLFHLHRITSSDALRVIPMNRIAEFYRYFTVEVKDKELLKSKD